MTPKPADDAETGATAAKGPAAAPPLDYASTERKANSVDVPLAAVTLWQAFIDSKPKDKEELASAKEQLAKWKKLAEGGAEKIKGKWVGGPERKQILEKAKTLNQEGWKLLKADQTLAAVKKFDFTSAKVSFERHFILCTLIELGRKVVCDFWSRNCHGSPPLSFYTGVSDTCSNNFSYRS